MGFNVFDSDWTKIPLKMTDLRNQSLRIAADQFVAGRYEKRFNG